MIMHPDDPKTWPGFRPVPFIAHDVGRSRDRSTAVVGGNSPFQSGIIGIDKLEELPQGLFGSQRASALAKVDRLYNNNCLIVADLSNDATYAEVLFEAFGPRVIGLHITRNGDGMHFELRSVKNGVIRVYTIGRSYLLELFHAKLQARQIRFADDPNALRACEQLVALQTEMTETETLYRCLPGQHDDLAISCAMLVWAAGHPDLPGWFRPIEDARRPRRPRPNNFGWGAFV
jgi:hypothetical protein